MSEAIRLVSARKHDPHRAHERIKDFYDWSSITRRTEVVYESVMKSSPYDFWTRMHRFVFVHVQSDGWSLMNSERTLDLGPIAGIIFAIILLVDCLFFMVLEWWLPEDELDKVRMHWGPDRFRKVRLVHMPRHCY